MSGTAGGPKIWECGWHYMSESWGTRKGPDGGRAVCSVGDFSTSSQPEHAEVGAPAEPRAPIIPARNVIRDS
jgi:hypothetical protein